MSNTDTEAVEDPLPSAQSAPNSTTQPAQDGTPPITSAQAVEFQPENPLSSPIGKGGFLRKDLENPLAKRLEKMEQTYEKSRQALMKAVSGVRQQVEQLEKRLPTQLPVAPPLQKQPPSALLIAAVSAASIAALFSLLALMRKPKDSGTITEINKIPQQVSASINVLQEELRLTSKKIERLMTPAGKEPVSPNENVDLQKIQTNLRDIRNQNSMIKKKIASLTSAPSIVIATLSEKLDSLLTEIKQTKSPTEPSKSDPRIDDVLNKLKDIEKRLDDLGKARDSDKRPDLHEQLQKVNTALVTLQETIDGLSPTKGQIDLAIVMTNAPSFPAEDWFPAMRSVLEKIPHRRSKGPFRVGFFLARSGQLEPRLFFNEELIDDAARQRLSVPSNLAGTETELPKEVGKDLRGQFKESVPTKRAILIAGPSAQPIPVDAPGWRELTRVDVVLIIGRDNGPKTDNLRAWEAFCTARRGMLLLWQAPIDEDQKRFDRFTELLLRIAQP